MECTQFRDALSARLDGEDPGLPAEALDTHLAGCAGCRAWEEAAVSLARRARLAPVGDERDVDLDLAAAVMARVGAPPRARWAREQVVLLVLALAQLALAIPDLVVSGHVHAAREVGALEVSLALGFLIAAARPARAWGMAPLVVTVVAGLLATSAFDVIEGQADVARESAHLLAAAGSACLWSLARRPAPSLRLRAG